MTASPKPRIMVVDDERDIVIVTKRGLEERGFIIDGFSDPLEAIEHFKPSFYDLILTDIRMPNMNGFQLYRKIRSQDPKVKVCFMTAFEIHRKEFETMFPNYDISHFIKKPMRVSELESVIMEQLKK